MGPSLVPRPGGLDLALNAVLIGGSPHPHTPIPTTYSLIVLFLHNHFQLRDNFSLCLAVLVLGVLCICQELVTWNWRSQLYLQKPTACWTSYTTGEYHHKIKIRYQCSQEGPLHQKGGHVTHCSHNCDHSQSLFNTQTAGLIPRPHPAFRHLQKHMHTGEPGSEAIKCMDFKCLVEVHQNNCVVVWHTRQPKKAGHNSHNHNLTAI